MGIISMVNKIPDLLQIQMESKQQLINISKQKSNNHSLNIIYLQNFFCDKELEDFLNFFKQSKIQGDIMTMSFKEIDQCLLSYRNRSSQRIYAKTPEVTNQHSTLPQNSQQFDYFDTIFTKSDHKSKNSNTEKKIKQIPYDVYFSPQKKSKPVKQTSMFEKNKVDFNEDFFHITSTDFKMKPKNEDLKSKKQLINDLLGFSTIKVKPHPSNNSKQQVKVLHARPTRSCSTSQIRSTNASKLIEPKSNGIRHKKNDSYIQQIPCQKINTSQLCRYEKVKMYKHEIITKSFFSLGYVLYHIQVLPANKIIKRNYDDFQRLRNILEKQFPAIRLPYLEPSNWLYETSIQSIKKQKIMLQYFLNDLLSRKQFKSSAILQQFLNKLEHKDMKKSFMQFEKNNNIKCIQQLKNQEGYVRLDFKALDEQNFDVATNFYKSMHAFLDNLYGQVDNFINHLNSLTKSMANINDIFTRINSKVEKYNQNLQIKHCKLDHAPKIIQSIQNDFKKIQQKFLATKDSLENQLLNFLKYEKSNIETLDPLINTYSLFSKAYGRRIAHDDAFRAESHQQNSIKLYLSDKKSLFKHHLMEQSKDNLVLQYQNGFFKQQLLCEIDIYFEHFLSNLKDKFEDLYKIVQTTEKQHQTKEIKLLFQ